MVLQWCYNGPTMVLQWCYIGVTVVLQWRYSGVTVVLQWCYSGVTVVLQHLDDLVHAQDGGHGILKWCQRVLESDGYGGGE
jgi:hypothetical protein